MTILQRAELHILSRGLPVATHLGVEIRAATENAAAVRRALELIRAFGWIHLARTAKHSRIVAQSVRPTSYSSHDIRAVYIDFDSLWHESMLATILIYNSSTAKARSMLDGRSPSRFSDKAWMAICKIGVERALRFLAWYADKYEIPADEREVIANWVRSFPDTSTRRARLQGLYEEARTEPRRLVAWLRRFRQSG